MKKMKLTICVLVIGIILSVITFSFAGCAKSTRTNDYIKVIQKNASEEFVILQLSDIQLHKNDEAQLAKSFAQIEKLITESKPNLIVLTGDQVECDSKKESILLTEKIVAELDKYNIPYAPVFGNHDRQKGGAAALAETYRKGKNCLFLEGSNEIHGLGNYIIEIKEKEKTLYQIYIFDSNSSRNYTSKQKKSNPLGGTNYDYIYPNQITWYEENVLLAKQNANEIVKSLLFFHIALPEFRYYSEDNSIIGEKREEQCSPHINTGLFAKAKDLGSTKGIFVGHDHINNYFFEHEGIKLGYGMKTGGTSYFDDDMQGGSVIRFNANMSEFTFEHIFVAY